MKALPQNLILAFFILVLNYLFQPNFCYGQDINQIKETIQILSSDSLWGRSLYQNGKFKTLQWLEQSIKNEIKAGLEIKTHAFDTTFNQITKAELSINGNQLAYAQDYIVSGISPSVNINLDKITAIPLGLNKSDFITILQNNAKLNDCFLLHLADKSKISKDALSLSDYISVLASINPKAIFIESHSLLGSVATFQYPFALVDVKPSLIPVQSNISLKIESNLLTYPVQNLICINDSLNREVPRFTLMAHYDHLGTINDSLVFNGANDNASGVALALQLFFYLNQKHIPAQLILTDAEELGLIGSKQIVNDSVHYPISLILNLDMIGSSLNGIGIVGGIEFPDEVNKLKKYLPNNFPIKERKNSAISDQYWFLKTDIKGLYIYSNEGKQPYHSMNDDFQSLDYLFIEKLFESLKAFSIENRQILIH